MVRAALDGVTVTSLVEPALQRLLDGNPKASAGVPYDRPVLPDLGSVRPGTDLYANAALLDLMDEERPVGDGGGA